MLVHLGEWISFRALCQNSEESHELASCRAECCQKVSTLFAHRAVRFRRMINPGMSLRMLARLVCAHPENQGLNAFQDNARDSLAKTFQHFLEWQWDVFFDLGTHNGIHSDICQFTEAVVAFFNLALPRELQGIMDFITDSFPVITDGRRRLIG